MIASVQSVFVIAILCIIGGLVICALSGYAKPAILALIAWWVGIIVFVVGLLLALVPILAWIRTQLIQMLGI